MRSLTGQTFGSYILEEPLGSGGMGEVYAARHVRLTKRRAAVKVLPSSLATEPEFLRRFEAEANAAASLDHPNVLGLWEYGEHEGMPFLVMPLIPGGSLKELLERRGPLTAPEAGRILTQIAAALDYAHGRGLLHRDVKPANILLTEEGRPVLADFGIAKVMEATQTQITRAGTGIGTPEYMAPEQLEGNAERRSDLYALGVVLYQMLTGKVPYSGSTPYAIAYQQLEAPLPSLRAANPRVPVAVERVLERALAKDPAQRYATGREFALAFEAASANDPHDRRTGPLIMTPAPAAVALAPIETPAYRPPAPSAAPLPAYVPLPAAETAPPRQSNPWPLAVAALLALVLLAGGALAYLTLNRAPAPAAAATATSAPPNFAATGTALAASVGADISARATRTAEAVTLQNAVAAGTSTAQAALQATATGAAQADAARTATAGAAQATQQAQVAGTGTAQTQATAQAGAVTATTAAAIGATQTTVANVTATALARPSPTPPPPTAPPPTPPPPTAPPAPTATTAPPAAWGPTLAPLTGGKAYTDPQQRFALSVPRDWTVKTNPDSSVTFTAPGNTAAAGVMVDDLTRAPNTTVEQYAKAVEDQLKQQADYQQLSFDKVLIGNQQALRRIYRVRSSGGALIQAEQLYVVANGLGHRVTFQSLPNTFSSQQPTFDAVAGSYRVLK